MIMTPLGFAQKYKNLETYVYPLENGNGSTNPGVPAAPSWLRLPVTRYRLGKSSWDHQFWLEIAKHIHGSLTVRVKTIAGSVEEKPITATQLSEHFHFPFVGKGTPEQAQIAIQLLYRYHKAKSTPEQFVNQDFIGLDCNGFVGNYIRRVLRGVPWTDANNNSDPGPTTYINDLLSSQGQENQIRDMKDLRPQDAYLFGHCDASGKIYDPSKTSPTAWGHVMITEPWTLMPIIGGYIVTVVEATAAGKSKLRDLPYTIKGTTKGVHGTVFHVLRGSPDAKMDVRIARLKVPSGAYTK
jgi:hypothetical protein